MSSASTPNEAPGVLAAALDHHQSGRADEAEQLYRQALSADPAEPTALYLYGLLNFETGRAEQAAELFDRVVAVRPNHVEALATLAGVRHWLGEHEAAITAYQRVRSLDRTRLDAAVGLANALREAGQAEAALAVARSASEAFADAPAAHMTLAAALSALRDWTAAADAYRRAGALDPELVAAKVGLALVLLEAGEAEEAAREAEAALTLSPTLAEGWFVRGAAAMALQRPEEAITAFECAAVLDPSRAATQLSLGAAFAEHGDAEAAKTSLEAALALDPTLAEAHASLSSVYMRSGDPHLAEVHCHKALALDPMIAEAHQNLAALLAELGDGDGARRHRDLAYAGRNLFIERAPAASLTVLMPTTAESGNVPLDHLMPKSRFSRLRWVVEYAGEAQGRALPPYDVVFNAIGDVDLAGPTTAPLEDFLADCERKVLNPPFVVARTRRDWLSGLLAGLDGAVVPAAARLEGADVAREGLKGAVRAVGLETPVLIRPLGAHGGKGLQLAADDAALEALATASDVYATRFHDYRSADGKYRKYRVIFVDRHAYAYHLAVSDDWMVHYESAGMDDDPAARAEEVRFLADPAAALGELATQTIEAIGRRLDLDYGGIDFTLLDDGRVLVFEANATMLVHPEEPGGVFAYKNAAAVKIIDAFQAMLRAAARA